MDNPGQLPAEHPQDAPEAVTLAPATEQPLHARAQSPVLIPEQPFTNSTTPDHLPPPPAAPPSTAAYSPFAIPHPKRFSAVNINKKFLQKNSTTSAASAVASGLAVAAKAGSPARMSLSLSSFRPLMSPCSPACTPTIHLAFQASHRQAHLDRSTIHNYWLRLVPPVLCNPARLYHTIEFFERTTSPAARTNTSSPSIPSCWQSHTTTTKERLDLILSIGQEGCLHKTCVG